VPILGASAPSLLWHQLAHWAAGKRLAAAQEGTHLTPRKLGISRAKILKPIGGQVNLTHLVRGLDNLAGVNPNLHRLPIAITVKIKVNQTDIAYLSDDL
jgi:hypothetical protein